MKNNTFKKRSRIVSILSTIILTGIMMCLMCIPSFAAVDTKGISDTTNNIITVVQILGGGLAVVFLVLCGIKFMSGGREGMHEAKGRLVGLIIGIIMVGGAAGIKALIASMSSFH